jgi:hypothetical protein
MFALAAGNERTGQALANPERVTQGPGTIIDGSWRLPSCSGLVLNAMFGAWRAGPLDALVIVFYALREAMATICPGR